MNSDQFMHSYYERVAKNYGDAPSSSMQDQVIRDREVEFFCKEIAQFIKTREFFPRILDVGCGNGYLLQVLSLNFPHCQLFGLEFSPDLCEIARKRDVKNCQIIQGDMRLLDDFPQQFDIIISERSVINILDWSMQKRSLENIAHSLAPSGVYLMSESFKEPWENLNKARKQMTLDPIEQSPQNLYLTETIVNNLSDVGLFESASIVAQNNLSTHFYTTRVMHRVLRPEGGRKKGSEFSQFLEQAIPSDIGNYSPILFRRFEKALYV